MGGAGAPGLFSINPTALQALVKQLENVEQNMVQMNGQYAKLAADLHAGWGGPSGQKLASVASGVGRTHMTVHSELKTFLHDMKAKLVLMEGL